MAHGDLPSRLAGKVVVFHGKAFYRSAMLFVEQATIVAELEEHGPKRLFEKWLFEPAIGPVNVDGKRFQPIDRPGGGERLLRRVAVVSGIRVVKSTSSGLPMGYVMLQGRSGARELIVWDRQWRRLARRFRVGDAVALRVRNWKRSARHVVLASQKIVVLEDHESAGSV